MLIRVLTSIRAIDKSLTLWVFYPQDLKHFGKLKIEVGIFHDTKCDFEWTYM